MTAADVDAAAAGPIVRRLPGARAAAVLCHSHPLQGGSMYDRLLHRIACGLHAAGVSTLRFGFREGREADDVRAGLDVLAADHAALAVVGYSFGAHVGLRVGAGDPRVGKLVGLGLPTGMMDCRFVAEIATPLLLVHGERDEVGPLASVRALAGRARLVVVPGCDHAFRGHLDAAAAATVGFLRGE